MGVVSTLWTYVSSIDRRIAKRKKKKNDVGCPCGTACTVVALGKDVECLPNCSKDPVYLK